MAFWVTMSWILVIALTGVNIFVFFKLKQASEQMMQMAFPGAKNMNEALARMNNMSKSLNRGPRPNSGGNMDAQLRAAMNMLQQMQKNVKR